ncbi:MULTISPECIES: hypothetical protein [pseudomallei group]|uniref:hypothetical protein n=1 Tax=Burkholderia pseudomallei TaxID=28450 RepID=UPI000B2E1363|nr:hypothetical protein [Burkholderia pseudomallei]MBF3529371.1 hypothetical protein [Burkholderia pseudomallei]MBF3591102.1 hypothetical protein [Burkholderia pseudomallei]MBF3909510.1 hypothetical protein [Burkholderia pseudomallei]MBF3924640.1 hypothetical protein [Burkholderia pseudomallei]MBF3966893.1 hypothetical protein [Burkholderia pseudomallei]
MTSDAASDAVPVRGAHDRRRRPRAVSAPLGRVCIRISKRSRAHVFDSGERLMRTFECVRRALVALRRLASWRCIDGNFARVEALAMSGYAVTRLRGYAVTRLRGYAVTRSRGHAVMRSCGHAVMRSIVTDIELLERPHRPCDARIERIAARSTQRHRCAPSAKSVPVPTSISLHARAGKQRPSSRAPAARRRPHSNGARATCIDTGRQPTCRVAIRRNTRAAAHD